MHIGIDISKAGDCDGIGKYIYHLVKSLMDIDTTNQYTLYFLSSHASKVDLIKVFNELNDNFIIQTERAPRPEDIDIFHSTTFRAPLRYSGKLVFTVHDLTFITHPIYHTLVNKMHCLKGTIKAACYADKFIAVSNHTKQDLIKYLDIPSEKIDMIYPAVAERFRPLQTEKYRDYLSIKFGITSSYVLNVGTIEPRKNVKRLIEAYSKLPEDIKGKYSLVIVGEGGWLNSDIYTFTKQMNLETRIKFLGYVDDNDLPILYSCSEVFVYPSIYEGFGLPVLEAMACGAPVITSQASSLPEVAGDAAVLVEPYDTVAIRDAIIEIITNRDKGKELGNKGIKRSQLFSWSKTAEQTLAVYNSVVKSPKK